MKQLNTITATKQQKIGKTIFIVTSHFRTEGDATIVNKIERLIEAEITKS